MVALVALGITSCSQVSPELRARIDKAEDVLEASPAPAPLPYAEGSYEHFICNNGYPTTMEIYRDKELLKKAVKADSKLIDIVELYALIRRKPLSDEQRNTVLSIQDSETGRTRADTLRRELKGQYDSMRRKMTASLKSCRFASVMVNGRNAHCVFYMNSMNGSTPQKVSVDLVKVKNRWLILKSVTENLPK